MLMPDWLRWTVWIIGIWLALGLLCIPTFMFIIRCGRSPEERARARLIDDQAELEMLRERRLRGRR
jgi:hypothetical protein